MLRVPSQTCRTNSREFQTRHKKRIQAIRNDNSNSGYSNHTLNRGHKYWTMTYTIDIIRTYRKEKHLTTLEKCHINKNSNNNRKMNDKYQHTHTAQ
jgi:hypothetical protein